MRPSHVYVTDRAKWNTKYGALPRDPLRSYDGPGLYNTNGEMWCSQSPDIMCKPYVIKDCPDHITPSGRIANGRYGKREEIARSEGTLCEWEPVTKMVRGLGNLDFAKKYKAAARKDRALVKFNEKSAAFVDQELDKIEDGLADAASGRVKPYAEPLARDHALEAKQRDVLHKHGVAD